MEVGRSYYVRAYTPELKCHPGWAPHLPLGSPRPPPWVPLGTPPPRVWRAGVLLTLRRRFRVVDGCFCLLTDILMKGDLVLVALGGISARAVREGLP